MSTSDDELQQLLLELRVERQRPIPPPGGWTCPCGLRAQKHGRLCEDCQRQAVLAANRWNENTAQRESRRGLAELRRYQKNRIIREGLA